MKKRVLSIFLALCMALTLMPAATVTYAEKNTEPTIVLSEEKALVGDEVVITVSTENNPGVMALTLELVYDNTKLELVGYENAGFTGWQVNTSAVWIGSQDSDYNGVILKLKFKVLDTAPNGMAEVSLICDKGDACNSNEEVVNFQIESGGVNVHIHNYTAKVTAPTCTEQGYTTYTCSCGDSYVDNSVKALGHDFGDWKVTKAATETEKGVETRYCSRCDAYETRDIAPIVHTHSYASVVTAPTCTDKGYTTYTCSCGDSYVDNYTDALGHNYVDGKCTICDVTDPNYKPEEPKPQQINPFVDVKEGTDYYDAILWAYNHTPERITEGSDATHFNPNGNCTRGQVVTFLWRAEGCPEPTGKCPFVDVSSASPYYKAIIWAAEQGITNGYDATHFAPNATVTRAQFVTFLWRYEGKPAANGTIDFADASQIAAPFKDAVAWAVSTGVTNGYEDGSFRPNATCTRWAVVLFMYRDLT